MTIKQILQPAHHDTDQAKRIQQLEEKKKDLAARLKVLEANTP